MLLDLLSERVPVQPKHLGGADLVAPRRGQCGEDQRLLQFGQDALVKAGRRKALEQIERRRTVANFLKLLGREMQTQCTIDIVSRKMLKNGILSLSETSIQPRTGRRKFRHLRLRITMSM